MIKPKTLKTVKTVNTFSTLKKTIVFITVIMLFALSACGGDNQENNRFDIGGNYSYVADFSEGLAAVRTESGYDYIGSDGKVKLSVSAIAAGNFSEGRAWFIKSDGTGGYIDNAGNIIFESTGMTESTMRDFHESLAVVNIVQGYGVNCFIIDKDGNRIQNFPEYVNTGEYGDFCEGIARYSEDNNFYGYISSDGIKITEAIYNSASDFSCGAAVVSDATGNYVIGTDGEKLFDLPSAYTEYTEFSDELLKVKENGSWKYIDKQGNQPFSLSFEHAGDFNEGMAAVKSDGVLYVINKSGDTVFTAPEGTLELKDCSEGFFAYRTENGWGYLNSEGETVVSPYFDYAGQCSEGYVACRKDGNWGFVKPGE